MNMVQKLSAEAGTPEKAPPPDGREMVARAASERVRLALEDGGDRKALFMVAGMDAATTSAVALRIKRDHPDARVDVHADLADDTVPSSMIGTESIGEYRNANREPGRGAIVFAPSRRELDDVGKTAADIPQISEQSLMALPELWISCCPNLQSIDERGRKNLVNVLTGLAGAGICDDGIRMFGAFVHRLDLAFNGMEFERALDAALPALRIPRDAGQFKKLGARGRLPTVPKWTERFKELHAAADEALYLRKGGSPLPRPVLLERVSEMAEERPPVGDEELKVLRALVKDSSIEPGQWRRTQEDAAQLPWPVVDKLFKRAKKKAQEPLGTATLNLFQTKMPSLLKPEDKDLLTAVKEDGEAAGDAERDFFFRYRADIADYSKQVLKRWEAFVFRSTEQHADLALGLFIAIADLVDGTSPLPAKPKVLVRLHGADRQKFWAAHSQELCRFLRDRYRGLDTLFAKVGVQLDFGMCWTHAWEGPSGAARPSRPTVKDFRFDIFLLDESVLDEPPAQKEQGDSPMQRLVKQARGTTQFVWAMPLDSLASSYREGLGEIFEPKKDAAALLCAGRFSRVQDQDRTGSARISLSRRSSFLDASGQPNGLLVDRNDKRLNKGADFRAGLARLKGTILRDEDASEIEQAFARFEQSYSQALRALVTDGGEGLASDKLLEQARDYGGLLGVLRTRARKDECRLALWLPMLSVGVALADGSKPLAICMPWHPFKLAAAATKARRLAESLAEILSRPEAADVRTFARGVARAVADGWHPAVVLHTSAGGNRLLVETDQFADFALLEPPTADQGAENAFDGFSEVAADELLAVCDEYLELQPHQRANFSVVLYNAENRSLPSILAKELAAKVEQERDLRCDLILTHSEQRRLRQIYTEQNVTISSRLDDAMASEAAQMFLSRLRVGFIDLGGFGNADATVQAADVVFMHDVIARSARTSWRRIEAPEEGWKPFERTSPDAETRRRHFELGTRKTEALLVPAERPLEVQRYLDLVHDLHLGAAQDKDEHFVPLREIQFDGGGVKALIEQAHQIADWVVTYDAIADAHLFRSNGVKIIRYVPRPDKDHSLVVSTYQPSRTLVLRLSEEIGRILGISNRTAEMLAKTCVERASAISGRVVLRAARLENNALELLGLVLSRKVVEQSLDAGYTPVCWLLLDDFASMLGHKGQKADILTVCLSEGEAGPSVDLMIIESKFVSREGESEAMVESMRQMKATTKDLLERVVGFGDTLNRGTWLRRLADLLMEQGEFRGPVAGRNAQEWASLIRSGKAELRISGLSMVFVHDREDEAPEPLPSPGPGQQQHTFNRAQVREALRDIEAADQGRT